MKQISAICSWSLASWLVLSLALGFAFPGTGAKLRSTSSGSGVLLTAQDEFVLGGPMVAGVLALSLGLLGWLPGTSAKDDKSNGE